MKETINVNIGGCAFIIDVDAYQTLKTYLDDIRLRIDDADPTEVLDDIEVRIAEIFSESIHSANQVVDISLVHRAIAIIGRADTFGERRRTGADYYPPNNPRFADKKLYRSTNDRIIAGICSGVANYFGIDATLVRLFTFLLIFLGGLSLWVYIAMWFIIPNDPSVPLSRNNRK